VHRVPGATAPEPSVKNPGSKVAPGRSRFTIQSPSLSHQLRRALAERSAANQSRERVEMLLEKRPSAAAAAVDCRTNAPASAHRPNRSSLRLRPLERATHL
jgi:hypothetical protein